MSKIGDFLGWVVASLLAIWILAMLFSNTPCQRVHRSAWPVELAFSAGQYLSKNWTGIDTQLVVVEWKVKSVLGARSLFEKTVYGENAVCKTQ